MTREIPVIVVRADATPSQVERLLAAGATAYLTKPLDLAEFLNVLDDTLAKGAAKAAAARRAVPAVGACENPPEGHA